MEPLWSNAPSGIRIVRLNESEEVEALLCLFEQVAAAENWQLEGALRLWPERSI